MKKVVSCLIALSLVFSMACVVFAHDAPEESWNDSYMEELQKVLQNHIDGVLSVSPYGVMCCDRPMKVNTGSRVDHMIYPYDMSICILTRSHGTRCKNCGDIQVILDDKDYHTPGKYADCPIQSA